MICKHFQFYIYFHCIEITLIQSEAPFNKQFVPETTKSSLAKFPNRSMDKTTKHWSTGKSSRLGKSACGMLTFFSEKVTTESGS